jgi:hypothetical protein
MSLKLTGRILLVKSFTMNSDEVFSDFRRLPEDLPFTQAVEILKKEQEKLALSFGTNGLSEEKSSAH